MLELAEVAFDEVTLAVDAPADRPLDDAVTWAGDVSLGSGSADEAEEGVRVIASISDDMATLKTVDQAWSGIEVMALSRRKDDPHRQAVFIDKGVDLGA